MANTTNFICPTLPTRLAYSSILGKNAAVSISFLERYFSGQVPSLEWQQVKLLPERGSMGSLVHDTQKHIVRDVSCEAEEGCAGVYRFKHLKEPVN